jgi:hypothetical protein
MLRLPKLLKDDGIFIFESWAQGNESYATPKDAKDGTSMSGCFCSSWDGLKSAEINQR